MKKAYLAIRVWKGILPILAFISSNFSITQTKAQCVAQPGIIEGFVYQDNNNNGKREIGESTIANVLVSVYNVSGELVAYQSTDVSGNYSFGNLTDNKPYRLGFEYLPKYTNAFIGADNGTNVQLVEAPACNASLGLVNTYFECGANPNLFTTCFVQGATNGSNAAMETIVSLEYNFNGSSTVSKFAMHGETGPVWGLAWKSITGDLFSSSFIKQYSGLTPHGHGAIFRTKVDGNEATSTTLFTKMSDLGVDVGVLPVSDPEDCAYGSQVGKYGLGAMVISPAEDYLYVVNLYGKSIVKLPIKNPTSANTTEISIPNPGCSAGDFAPFALKYYNDKLYIGITCTEEKNQSALNSAAVVYEMDLQANTFTNIFSTNYLKGYWHNEPYNDFATQHWFTDIDFTDDGNMVIAFTDRIGHKFCNKPSNRLDHQFPDILMVWNNNGTWTLESNGHAGAFTGSGAGNTQGPDGGEFFGLDHWITQPAYHPEIALGSIYVLPGTGSVVTTAYDPGVNSYSGGVQRYSTTDGSKLGAKELYIRQTTELFGKATGFGEIIGRCGLPKIQVGNLVWFDANKNGLQDAGEQVAAGIPIKLLNAQCQEIGSATTNTNGQYAFSDLNPGEQYYLALPGSLLDLNYQLITIEGKNYIFSPGISNNAAIDNNAVFNLNGCGYAIIPVNYDKTNHNLDIGLIEANGFDLALKNEIVSNEFSRYNELVDFRMTIYNQGGVPAQNIEITNYIPAGFSFSAADNPAWSLENGVAKTTLYDILLPGSSTATIIKLRIISGDLNNIVDVAEISRATDHQGLVQSDMDSTPDAISGNDVGGDVNTSTDNKIDDDGTIDEDDEDPAIPRVLDLALKQVVNENCLSGGDCFNIVATVYNQGNVAVSSFNVSNYFHALLSFDSGVNGSWQKDGEILNFTGGSLNTGQSINIPLSVCVKEGVLQEGIVEYAEISEIKVNGSATNRDFDSNPDNNSSNDAGGIHSTAQDNYIFGTMDVEEDDHDPVYLGVQYIDLALILTTEERKISEGETVCFDINIYNQGSQTISAVNIVDYIPAGLKLTSADWTMIENNIASKTLKFENGLESGATYTEKICFEVGDISGIYYIENYAEINSVTDICGNDVSTKDIDSKADHNKNNDNGGHPQTETDNIINGLPSIDEDDHDPAVLINYDVIVSACECLDNASNGINGQFEQIVTVRGPKGMTWYIDQVANLYNDSSLDPPASPTPYVTGPAGYILTEVPYSSTISDYVLSGIYTDGQQWTLVLKSTLDDYEGIKGGGCSYDPVAITGTASLCTSAIQVYSAPYSVYGYHVTLSGGGTIISALLDSSNVTVQWGAIPGVYSLNFDHKSPFSCDEPGILNVAIGNPDLSMACKSQIQVSLDADCHVEITPAMLVAGDLTPSAPYVVMLLDDKGNLLPGNVLTAEHAGKTVIGKMIEGCSGNSCWSTLKIEDKTPPAMQCAPLVEVSCYKADQYPGPVTTDNCGGEVTIYTLDSLPTPLYCNQYNKYIDKTYQAVDKWGNKSALCKQRIAVKRIDMNQIVFPENMKMANALTCNDYETDEYGFPDPSETGAPTIEGWPIYPNFSNECNIGVSYIDRDFGYIGCVRKIMRVWTVYEGWCTEGVILQDTQTLIIADTEAPNFNCPSDLTFSAGYGQCEAFVTFPGLTNITDDCSNVFSVDIKYPGGFLNNKNGGNAFLPAGVHKVTYIVHDQCLQKDSCSIIVTVLDKTPPVVVCDQNTIVGLNSFGEAYVYASTIDEGSYDACGIDSIKIRRMDLGAPCLDTFGFRDIAQFCCDDVGPGNPVMVEVRVWDINGNSNSCMVTVTVQDKTAPTITCPPNVSISCETDYNILELDFYGEATAQDACGVEIIETPFDSVDQCRRGYIRRVFTASDGNGTSVCTSYVHLIRPYTTLSIGWPENYFTTNGCTPSDLSPENLPAKYAKPGFLDGACDMVSASHEDQYFPFDDGQGSCYKIVRTWTVIDWCRMNEPGYIPATHQQLIKVSNTVAPSIEIDADDEACTDETSCTEGYIDLFAEGDDDCTPLNSLFWSYEIDFNYDGSFEADIEDHGKGHEIDASGFYDMGKHRILFTFEDRCGNLISEFHDFEIKNCKSPIASCKYGTSIGLAKMVINGVNVKMACITARSLNASSSHPCNADITFAFSNNVADTIKCFDCTDLSDTVKFDLYVIDEFGFYSTCETFVIVQNNDNTSVNITSTNEQFCNGESTTLTVSGIVGTYVWSTGATTSSITVSPATTTTYSVSVTSEDGCTLSASEEVEVLSNPNSAINVTGGTTICMGKEATLTASGGVSYLWNTGATTSSITVSPVMTTSYNVTVTAANGCTGTASVTITVNGVPNAAITTVNPICAGQMATLTASGGGTYLWSNNATTASITVSPATTTVYTVTVTNAQQCTATATRSVTVNPLPTVSINNVSPICFNQSATLTATGNGSYVWSTGATTASIIVTPATTTTYTVTVTSTAGCTATASRTVTVNPLPPAAIGSVAPICAGASASLTAAGGGSYLWSTGATTATINVTPATTTSYTVTVTSAAQCTATATATVTVNPLPVAAISGSNAICIGESTTLTASGGTSFLWNTVPSQTTASITVNPTGTTTYVVTVTNANGCTDTESKVLTVNSLPIATISGDLNICLGESTTLTAAGGTSFNWNTTPPQTTASITVSPTTTTTYTVTVTNANGCTDTESATVTVTLNNVPIANCQNATVYLNAQGEIVLNPQQVNNGSAPGCDNLPLTFSVTPNQFFCNDINLSPITVTLTVSSSNGSSATCTAQVTVLDTLPPVISCPGNVTFNCATFNGLGGLPGATATDNCPPPTVTVQVINATNSCNIGTITRTYTAVDASTNESECTQVITITGPLDPLTIADIVFPADTTLNACTSIDPSVTGNVVVNSANASCTNTSISRVDVNLNPNTPCNYTIQRTWTVIDSCILNTNTGAGIFTDVQLILVNDNQPPVITGYADITITSDTCPVQVNYAMGNVSITDCSQFTVTNNSPFASNNNSGNPSGLYDEGIHQIIVAAMDACGNTARDTFLITVIVTGNGNVICHKIVRNINDMEFVDVEAEEFVTVSGTCNQDTFTFTYSDDDITDTIGRYFCDDIGDIVTIIYFWDNGVLFDSCRTLLTIQDPPPGFCTGNIFRVTGTIITENQVPVKDVQVILSGMPAILTDKEGKYLFHDMQADGDYMIKPLKDDGLTEGISTLDLILIQRHILGVTKLNSPYKMVAADVNNDDKISASDLVELRKAILGTSTNFKNNTSWKMIDGRYSFPDPTNPFNDEYPLYYELISPEGNKISDFVGVKIGDVNNTFTANALTNSATGSETSLILNDAFVSAGKEFTAKIGVNQMVNADGLQLEFDVTGLTDIELHTDLFAKDELYYHVHDDKLLVVITSEKVIELGAGDFIYLTARPYQDGLLSTMMRMTDDFMQNEIYENLVPRRVAVKWNDETIGSFMVKQNTPNPWSDKTSIICAAPSEGFVTLKIKNVTGATVFINEYAVVKGDNELEIRSESFQGQTGVFLYELSFSNETALGKMIRIK